ncbi:dihydrofolate reductase [Azospirillum picis]|uniref:Dihydrofolate reductase n=1 Tax=Azospirillum picis TaxID=488438 RepID=A0ABU0ML58_9PROT|nr:dihydrofolate reductase [Azospirillum picis]MBP2300397.1 dihydrofolate reductase [Azospirillum picis]MDQ0534193.1 dihydrofolate reductase [Azospirillum picis]
MRISLVVAAAENGVIGRDGGLPWHLPGDLKRFRELTLGKPVLMGRRTWESLPRRPLPGRDNLVLSRSAAGPRPGLQDGLRDGAHWFPSIGPAIAWAQESGAAELCVIGGAALFREALPIADCVRLTRVQCAVDGDTMMPPIGAEWTEVWSSAPMEENGLLYRYIDLERAPA